MSKKKITGFVGLCILMLVSGLVSCSNEGSKNNVSLPFEKVFFDFTGGNIEIPVNSNSEWTINNSSEWCITSVEQGQGDDSFVLSVLPNDTILGRSTTLVVATDDISSKLVVQQQGEYDTSFAVPPNNMDMRDLTSVQLTQEMGAGWNIGNSLEAIGGETAWGNPLITQQLIDAVQAAGFNAIRIPVAWSKFSDADNFIIEESWKERVEEVVNYVLGNGMYAILNIHWDGGWMQPTYDDEEYVNNRLAIMWEQIATHFRDYNDYLLFAGTNEVTVEGFFGTPTVEYYTVQNGFNQTFVNTVRSTGGRNVYRHLVVQGFNTNIDHTVNFAVMPRDVIEDRLMMEVHYYDPYNFTINENSTITQWGMNATDPNLTETWANEEWVNEQFEKMKTNFVDQGYGVILGEYGTLARLTVDHHAQFREYYTEYVTQSMVDHGLVPVIWDNGAIGNNGMGLFNRSTSEQVYPEIINAIIKAVQ